MQYFKDLPIKPMVLRSILESLSFTLAIFVGPAVAILAIKAVWDMGKDV